MCSGTCWWKIVGAPAEVQVVYPTIYKLHGFILDWWKIVGMPVEVQVVGSLSHHLQTSWLYFGLVRPTAPPLLRQRRTRDVFLLVFVGHIWINVLRYSLMEDSWYASWGTGSLSHYLQTSWLYFGWVRPTAPPLLRQRRTRDVFLLVFVGHIWINVLRHSLMEDSWYASWGTGILSHYLQTSWLYFGLVRSTAPPLLRQRRTWDVFFFGFRWTYLNQCAPVLVDGR